MSKLNDGDLHKENPLTHHFVNMQKQSIKMSIEQSVYITQLLLETYLNVTLTQLLSIFRFDLKAVSIS